VKPGKGVVAINFKGALSWDLALSVKAKNRTKIIPNDLFTVLSPWQNPSS
jgi:hypothetical protein